MLRSVGWSLVLFSGGTTLLILLVLGSLLYLRVTSSLETTGIVQLDARAATLRQFLDTSDDPGDGAQTGIVFGGGSSGTFAVIVGPEAGRWSTPTTYPGRPAQPGLRRRRPSQRARCARGRPGERSGPDPERDGAKPMGTVVIQVVEDRTQEQRVLDVMIDVLVFGGLLAVIGAGAVGAFYARRALAPIRASLVLRRQALRRQREFAADASHALRTPLTVIRSSVDYLARHRSSPSVRSATRSMTSLPRSARCQ